MIKSANEEWRHDVEIWNAGSQRGFLEGTQLTSNYIACIQFLKDFEKFLISIKKYWAAAYSSLMWDEREAIKEFNVSIQDYWKLSSREKYVITRRFRENEKLRLSIEYGLSELTHHTESGTVTTRKEHDKNYWMTFYYYHNNSPLRIWGYGDKLLESIRNHQACLAWLDSKAKEQKST